MPASQVTRGLLRKCLRAMDPWGWMAGAYRTCDRFRTTHWTGWPSCCNWWRMRASGRGSSRRDTRPSSLIPGGGPPGHPPADGPVHGLPALAGTRVRDVLLYQEAWAHPEGFCRSWKVYS